MGLSNNDIFKKLRVAHKLRDDDIVKICALKDFRISKSEINSFFRKHLAEFGFKGFRKFKTRTMDKGHHHQFQAFVDNVCNGGDPLITVDEMVNVTLASFAAVTSALESRSIEISLEYHDSFSPKLETES